MAFIVEDSNTVSFAEFTDVKERDQRLFDSNESLTLDFVEDALERTTSRLLENIKNTEWWQRSYGVHNGSVNRLDIPAPDADKIKSRQQDFTDMCVYYTLKEFLLPLIADFGNEESNEVQKIKYYEVKFNDIFNELLALADWYDADGDGTVESGEKAWTYQPVRRSRRRSTIVKVR